MEKALSISGLRCPNKMRSRLLLADGTRVEGCGFGAEGVRVGEVVFTTSMTGYTEALTDPSYAGQILVWTHPMVGCYGVTSRSFSFSGLPYGYESDRIHVEGFIVSDLPPPNHYLSLMSLDEWLRAEGVPGMWRVDTRALVKKLREEGVMMGVIAVFNERDEVDWGELEKKLRISARYEEGVFVYRVSVKDVEIYEPPGGAKSTVSLLDCGVKYGILRWLLKKGFRVVRYPCWTPADVLIEGVQGVVLSNGPGNPAVLDKQIRIAKKVAESGKPVLGICLGHQLLGLALGAKVKKLKYGHRGPNKGVADVITGRSYITTQNHGYALDPLFLDDAGFALWFRNIDDGSVEGVLHRELPIIGVQFHPEGGPGPHDTTWIFDFFLRLTAKSNCCPDVQLIEMVRTYG